MEEGERGGGGMGGGGRVGGQTKNENFNYIIITDKKPICRLLWFEGFKLQILTIGQGIQLADYVFYTCIPQRSSLLCILSGVRFTSGCGQPWGVAYLGFMRSRLKK